MSLIMTTKLWYQKPAHPSPAAARLADELNVDPVIGRLLVDRGIFTFEEAKAFFRPQLADLHDPYLMRDMDKAVDRLTEAVNSGERILVFGDYDVDGTTAVTLVYSFLKNIGVDCAFYIPDRYKEGYGFSYLGVDYAVENEFSLIITLDCGIKDVEKVQYANERGIDIIICDHHNPGELPDAVAVLDPKRTDCYYPFKGLSGCGVGFKMLQAFSMRHKIPQEHLFGYLDLLTISIGADIVPLVGENRILAYYGLQQLSKTPRRPGIQAMLDQAAFVKPTLTITDVVFVLAPRINAAGRIFSGARAVELLLAQTVEEAQSISPSVEENNNTRKTLDKEITQEAIEMVDADGFYRTSYTTVVASEKWHKGVVGIVASRLVEAYYKPTIVLVEAEGKLAGSARSIPGVDLFEMLGKCSDLLLQFGGHTMAAGLSLNKENFEAFRERFDAVVAEFLQSERPKPHVYYDAELSLDQITGKFFRVLQQFAPFGPENMKPVFLTRQLVDAVGTRQVGADKNHLKLQLKQQGGAIVMDGIGFDLGEWYDDLSQGRAVDVLYTIEENEWNGKVNIQLSAKDIHHSGVPHDQISALTVS
jgi:single-stranded-DNA-specific exonuclease